MSTRASCRMFVIPAQAVPRAIILRRGPTQWYHLILWNTERDTFQSGAWFRGRIYEEKCDLSPDGHLFLYTAYKNGRGYTAISWAPWLHALVMWRQDTTYGGGGRFKTERWFSLRGVRALPSLPKQITVVQGTTEPHSSTGEVAGADWSGRDASGRLIYCVGGKVFRVVRKKAVELADFSGLRPDPQPSPERARL